tara:strand:+ start:18458 stop:18601 length:144 start_codon:yes stop_codon:yes gene_type:complete
MGEKLAQIYLKKDVIIAAKLNKHLKTTGAKKGRDNTSNAKKIVLKNE